MLGDIISGACRDRLQSTHGTSAFAGWTVVCISARTIKLLVHDMSRRSLVLTLALLPLTTIGAVIYVLPMQSQFTTPPRETVTPQDERLQGEPDRSAADADAPPQSQRDSSREPKGSEKDSQERDSTRTAPARPDPDAVVGPPMLASVAATANNACG